MSQVDDRIVALEFDNKQFESGAKQSLQTIENLKSSMKFDDMSKNLADFSKKATKDLDLTKIGSAVEALRDRFSASGIAGMRVIENLTDFALNAGKKLTHALAKPFDIMWKGGWSRAANIEDAKFQIEGLGVAFSELEKNINDAVAGTAYGFDAAAMAASQLSASGVKAGEDMGKALRAISGVASMTNSQYEEISPIFTTVAGQGKLMTMQLRQLEARGLNAAAELGKALGKTEQEVRDMVTKGKIDFKTFAEAMDSAFGEHATESNKTFSGALGNMQFALKKIGAEFAGPLREAAIPFFNQVRMMINAIKDNMSGLFPIFKDVVFMLSNIFSNKIAAITKFLKEDFKGATNIANGFKNIVQVLVRIIAALSTAFKEVFGPSKSVGDSINSAAEGFENFTAKLIPSNETLTVFKNIIVMVLKAIKSFGSVIKSVVTFISPLTGNIAKISGSVFVLIGRLVTLGLQLIKNSRLYQMIQNAGGLLAFAFEKVVAVFTKLKALASDNSTIFGRVASSIAKSAKVIIAIIGGTLITAIMRIINIIAYIKNNFPTVIDNIKNKITDLITRLREFPVFETAFKNIALIINKAKTGISNLIKIVKALFSLFRGETTRSGGQMTPLTKGMELLTVIGQKLIIILRIIGLLAGGALMGVASVFNTIMSAVRSIKLDAVINKIKELVLRIRDLELVRTAVEAFRNSGGNLIVTLQAIISKIREFFTNLRESGVSVLDFFIEKIRNVIETIKELFSSFGRQSVGDGLTRSMDGNSSFIDKLGEKFTKVKDVVVAACQKIRDEGLLTKVLMVAYVLAILKALVQIPSSIHKVSKSLTGKDGLFTSFKNIAGNVASFTDELKKGVATGRGLLGSLKDAVVQWGKAQKKSKLELLGGLLRDIAISIGILAGSLAVLSLIPADKLGRTALILGIFSAVLIGLATAITFASKTNLVNGTWFSSLSANMLAMTISIGILGALLVAFSKIKINDIWSAITMLGVMMLLMVAMGAVMKLIAGLDFSGTTLRSAIFMLAFAMSIKSLAKTLAEIAKIKLEDPTSFMTVLIGCVGSMAILVGVASAINPASALAIVAIVFALSKIIKAFKDMIAGINFEDLSRVLIEAKDQIMVMVIFVSAMVTAITIASLSIAAKIALAGAAIGKGLMQVGVAFLAFGIGLLMIQSAIKKMSKLDLLADDMKGLKNVALILIGVLVSFGVILALTNKLGGVDTALLKIAGAMALLSIAMFNISVVAHIVKNLEWGPILKALSILLVIMGSMAIMVAATKAGNGTLAFKTVLATVLGFTLLIGALIVLGLMCSNDKVFDDLKRGLLLIMGIMMSMALVLAQVSKINTGQSWKPILSMVVMLGAVFGALYLLSQNVHSLQDIVALAGISAVILGTLWGLIALTKSLTTFAKENNLGKSKAVVKSLAALGIMLGGFIAVAAVLAGFAVLTRGINAGEMALKAAAVIGTLYVLVISAQKLTTVTKEIKLADFGKMAAIMGAMIVALLAVTGAVAVIGMLDFGPDLMKKVIAVGLVLAELVGLSILMGKFGTASRGTFAALGSLAILTVIYGLLAAVCIALNMVPADNGTLAKSQTVALVLLELVVINAILGKLGAKTNALGAVGALCLIPLIAIFGLLALVCMALNMVPAEGFLAKSQTVMLVLVELATINTLLGLLVTQEALGAVGAIVLIPLIAIFGLLALVCGAISLIPADGILPKTQTVMLVLLELIALNALLGVLTMAAGVAELGAIGSICLIPLIAIFGLLALVCVAINTLPLDGVQEKIRLVMNTLWEMVGMLAVLGIISPLALAALAAVPGLVAICAALLVVVGSLKLLEGMSIDNMQETINMLTGALTDLVMIGVGATAASVGLVALGGAILMMGVACLAAGAGVQTFAEGVKSLASTTPKELANLQNVIMTFCTTIAQGIMTIIITTGQSIVVAVQAIISGVISAIFSGSSLIRSSGEQAGTSLFDGFKSKAMEIVKLPADILGGLIKGIGSTISGLFNAGLEMGKSIVEGFRSGAQWHSPPVWELNFFSDASTTAQTEGKKTATIFGKTGEEWGKEIETKFKTTMEKSNFFDYLKKKGLDAVNNLTSGLKMGEGDLISEVNFLNGIMGQLANARNLAARGFSSSVGDYKYQLESQRRAAVEKRNAIDYVNGTKAQRDAYIELNKEIGEYDKKINDAAKMMGMATEASSMLDLELNNTAESFGKAGKGAGGAAKEMGSFADKLTQTLEGQMNIFQKFEKKEAMSKDELLANMRSQIQGMTEWAAQMQSLAARGLDQGLYQELAMMGPQGAEYVGAFAQMTAEELAQANQLWAQSLVLPQQVAGQVAGAFNGIGQNIMAGEAQGIAAGKGQAITEAVNAQTEMYNQAAAEAGVASPSWKYADMGMYMMLGLTNGIAANERQPVSRMEQVCVHIYTVAQNNLKPSFFESIGRNIVYGLAKGIEDSGARSKLNSVLEDLNNKIQEVTEKMQEIHSPSRVFYRYGKYIVMGLANGISDFGNLAINATEDVNTNAINTMRGTINEIGKLLTDEVENPVITPVLDLSNIEAGARTLSNIFSANQALRASASLNLQNEQSDQARFGTTFIQNNYSPKALSRTEIYRQTKNQFSAYREAFT